MDDEYAQDAIERMKNMIGEKPPVLIEIKLSAEDKQEIYRKIEGVLENTAGVEKYMASIVAENIFIYLDDLIKFKNALAKQNLENKSSGKISPIFRRVDE